MARPKIKIELTTTDKVVEILGWFVLLAIWIFTISSYSSLPDTIPIHYNGVGKADASVVVNDGQRGRRLIAEDGWRQGTGQGQAHRQVRGHHLIG